MPKPLLLVLVVKLPRLKGVGVGQKTEAYVNSDGPIAMVRCLHQGNIYIKRKLRVWRDHKCIFLLGAENAFTCVGHQTTQSERSQYRAEMQTCVNWGGPIAILPCLHRGNIYIKTKIRVWRDQKCIRLVSAKTPLTCAGRQITPSQGSWYRP